MTNLELWNTVAIATTSLLAALLIYIWTAISLGAVFRKSGEPAWKGWVPILNIVVLFRLAGLSGWLVLLFIFPIAGWIALLVAVQRINVSFGYGGGMTVLAFFLFPVWASIVGFGPERWVGREVGEHRGPVRSTMAGAAEHGSEAAPPAAAYAPPPAYGRASQTGERPAPQTGWTPPPAPPQSLAAVPGAVGAARGPHHDDAPPAPVDSVPAGRESREAASAAAPADTPTPAPTASFPDSSLTAETPAAVPDDRYADDTSYPAPAAPAAPAAWAPAAAAAPAAARGKGESDDTPYPAPAAPQGPDAQDAQLDEYDGPRFVRRSSTPVEPFDDDLDEDDEWSLDAVPGSVTSEVTGAVTGAPAPVSATPAWARVDEAPEADAALPPVTRVPSASEPVVAREPWAPSHSPLPGEGEAFPESSGPVSAIAGAPDAGGPRSALASVSALHTRPHIPDEDDDLEQTIVARRKRTPWVLVAPTRARIPLTSETVILGRRPARDPEFPDAQLISLDDDTRTISKTHARLELRDERWFITDLDSTNGVLFATLMGTEVAATPGEATEAGDRFLLGDAEVSLTRSEE